MLTVYRMRLIEYECTWQNHPRKGQNVDCRPVAADGVYCHGVIKQHCPEVGRAAVV